MFSMLRDARNGCILITSIGMTTHGKSIFTNKQLTTNY